VNLIDVAEIACYGHKNSDFFVSNDCSYGQLVKIQKFYLSLQLWSNHERLLTFQLLNSRESKFEDICGDKCLRIIISPLKFIFILFYGHPNRLKDMSSENGMSARKTMYTRARNEIRYLKIKQAASYSSGLSGRSVFHLFGMHGDLYMRFLRCSVIVKFTSNMLLIFRTSSRFLSTRSESNSRFLSTRSESNKYSVFISSKEKKEPKRRAILFSQYLSLLEFVLFSQSISLRLPNHGAN
jgi:hypothetical protein